MGHERSAPQTHDNVFGFVFSIRVFLLPQTIKKKIKTIESICGTGGPKHIYQGAPLGIVPEKILSNLYQIIVPLRKEAQTHAECVGKANQPFPPGYPQESMSEM
jgi:hypothetical protein